MIPAIANLMFSYEQIEIEDLGMTVAFYQWASLKSRTVWASFDIMFGAALGDASVGAVLGNGV